MKLLKSLTTFTLLTAFTVSLPTATIHAAASINFKDIRGHWAASDVQIAVKKGYVDGYADETFKPEQNVSRAEFIKMAVTAMSLKTLAALDKPWYEPFIESAVTNGIHRYEDYTSGDVNTPITREEMARIAVRSAGEKNTDVLKWMYLATSKGIINGLDNQGTIGADQPTTRAQAITVIERMLKLKAGEKLPSDKYATSAAEVAWHKTNVYTMAPEYFGWGAQQGNVLDFNKLRYEDANGYFSETEKYIVVDMGDPTDPNRKLIPENMRWIMAVGNERTFPQDVPTNAYAFLSFDHFYVELSKREFFQYSYLDVASIYATGDNIGKDGLLIDVTPYAQQVQSGLQAGNTVLQAGAHDVRLVTGQLVPKMKGKDGNGFSIYKRPAQSLGESGNPIVYKSRIDHSLVGK
ncbi:S-layer homology domain-containing protein [Paenibacillus sp. WQ 127069]|uniref:S-layer homology domain-containing protein n=1 Tax=Paenibacillus baimaensis TaxID=2982185 RepID=A0ABT2UGJ5_9BACL|nr:S-layer homology domain-containing protein [Paenibacillus sp. WQ 127069]MCU6793753.1 S-layer homology domain-containing protein [Paenibacillus sp. WQ 127069]